MKQTQLGVGAPLAPPRPAPAAAQPRQPPKTDLPSDFPVALGGLGEADLPVVQGAGLPAARGTQRGPFFPDTSGDPKPSSDDSPTAHANLEALARQSAGPSVPDFDIDLPAVPAAAGTRAGLPVLSTPLPARPPSSQPAPRTASPPARAAAAPPTPTPLVPPPLAAPQAAAPQAAATAVGGFGDVGGFGEIELPGEWGEMPAAPAPAAAAAPPAPAAAAPAPPADPNSADFADLNFEFDQPPPASPRISGELSGAMPPPTEAARASGGLGFGEVDFGGDSGAAPAIGVQESAAAGNTGGGFADMPGVMGGVTAAAGDERPSLRERPMPSPRKKSIAKRVVPLVIVLAFVGGALLELKPQVGAFGRVALWDTIKSGEYQRAAASAIAAADTTLAADTYDAAKNATDATYAAHTATLRARPLAAFAALVDYAATVRFGPDTSRASRAKQLLAELPADVEVKYRDAAQAAGAAAEGDLDKARKGLDEAMKKYAGDPAGADVALVRGNVALAQKDVAAAVESFKAALGRPNDARAHFGLARAYDMMGDAAGARSELAAALAASPQHVGALTLRARMKSAATPETEASKDLAVVLEGPGRAKASPNELSRAYAAKAWTSLERGAAGEAREEFAKAVALDPRNVEALNGEGRLLLSEGRNTEALARFDTALQYDGSSPETIANDADAKVALEQFAAAKQQLNEARAKFPKSVPILLVLGRVEGRLQNNDAADAALRSAVTYADPTRVDSVLPYIELSHLLGKRGLTVEAKTTLDEAKKKLPPSAALDRAFAEVSEMQGEYEVAVSYLRSALEKDPRDARSHFMLGQAYRRMRKFDDAAGEFDQVVAVDKDYPNLSLERGLLFEESGDLQKAIDQFKGALAKAPNDVDLQLVVGSAYVMIGRPDEAIDSLNKVLKARPTNAEAEHYLGRAQMLQGTSKWADAMRHLKKAVELDPTRAEYHVYIAWLANAQQPAILDLATVHVDKALAIDKLNPEAYWQRGIIERIRGVCDDAIKDEQRALGLRPSRYEAHATIAECYQEKTDWNAALAEWAKYVAGDGTALTPDGTVAHPFQRYEYGKLLMERGSAGQALAQLEAAAKAVEKMESHPAWMSPLEFLAAEGFRKAGKKLEACDHYKHFLEIAAPSSPDRQDAEKAVSQVCPRN